MRRGQKRSVCLVFCATLLLAALSAYADTNGYGLVESYGNGQVVIRMENATGTWTVDKETRISGSIAVADWVSFNVATSGHVRSLKVEEVPAGRSGVVKEVRGIVLVVRSGNGQETWNVTPLTILNGIDRGQFQPGDEIGAKLYKNHNLAELTHIKRGVKVN